MNPGSTFPNLYGFLSGYFNQDWLGDYQGGEPEAVEDFRANSSKETVKAVAAELRQLLAVIPPEEITDEFLFRKFGCYTSSGDPNITNAMWLESIMNRLESGNAE